MKTGVFIEKSYQKEIDRIQKELQEAIPAILKEKEIIDLQYRVKVHETYKDGELSVHFNCGGGILLYYKHPVKGTYGCPQTVITLYPDRVINNEKMTLEQYHLKTLKAIHPKRFPELIRAGAKKFLLVEEAPATKPWWKFF